MSRSTSLVALAAVAACGGSPQHAAPVPHVPPASPVAVTSPVLPAPPATVGPDTAPLPLWPEVRTGKLANGLTYFILKHGTPAKRAQLWLAVNAGSVQEDDDQCGLAHLAEHMAFDGTRRFPKSAIIDYIEKIGMKFGADLNARTMPDDTVYQLEVPTDSPTYLATGLDILRDWAGDVTFDPAAVEKERSVVLEEWRLRHGAGLRLTEQRMKVALAGTRYPERLPIGDPETIKTASRDVLYRFYKDWYRPDLMAVIAVGDVEPATLEQAIEQRFGDLENPAHERARVPGGVPDASAPRISIEADRELPSTTVHIESLLPHRLTASTADYRRVLVEELYGRILVERYATAAKAADAPFSVAFGAATEEFREVDSLQLHAQVKGDKVEATLHALTAEARRMERHGVTADELGRARQKVLLRRQERAERAATSPSRALAEELTRYFFAHENMIGSVAENALTKELLPTITADEVRSAVTAFSSDNRAVAIAGPDDKRLPTRDRVLAIIDADDDEKAETAAPQTTHHKQSHKPLMPVRPMPGTILKETVRSAIGVTEWTLSNGVHVVVKPTDFDADAVAIDGYSPGGLATVSDTDLPAVRWADSIAAVGGVGELDATGVANALVGKDARVTATIGATSESIKAQGSVHDLETVFQLLHLKMTAPRKDVKAFERWKANEAERLANSEHVPAIEFARNFVAAIWNNDVRHAVALAPEVAKVDLDRALAFYKDRFGDASDFTFVIVGGVDLAKLKPLVETYLATLPATGRIEREKDLGARAVAGVVKKDWKLGSDPRAAATLVFHGDDAWSRDKSRDLEILKQVLAIKLREVLRADMGGVYNVTVVGTLQRAPHATRELSIVFGCDPARVDELIQATFAELDAIAKDGVAPADIEKITQAISRARETALRTNAFWLDWLASAYRFQDDPTTGFDAAPTVARVTAANLKASAKHFLDRKQYFQVVMLPAAMPPPAPAAAAAPAAPATGPAPTP